MYTPLLLNFFFLKNVYINKHLNSILHQFFKSQNCHYYKYYFYRLCYKITYICYIDIYDILYSLFVNIIKPNNYNWSIQIVLFYFKIYLKNSWTTYRHFFNYKKHQKTRNNRKHNKKLPMCFKHFLLKYIYHSVYRKYSNKKKELALHIEFFNKLWYFQWKSLWLLAQICFLKFIKIKKKQFKFGTKFSLKNKALTHKEYILKQNKKKVLLPINVFNIGFYFNFSKKLKKWILLNK